MLLRVLLLAVLPLFLTAQDGDSIPNDSSMLKYLEMGTIEPYDKAVSFPIDSIQLDSQSLLQYFKSRPKPLGKDKKYQISIDFLATKDTIVWITEEGTNYGYGGLRQRNVRVFFKQEGSGLFRMNEIKILGNTYYLMHGLDPWTGKKHFFQKESNCPEECTKRLVPTSVDVSIVDAEHIQVTRYNIVKNGRRRKKVQYNKLEAIPEILEISKISNIIFSMDWLSAPTDFYCECDE